MIGKARCIGGLPTWGVLCLMLLGLSGCGGNQSEQSGVEQNVSRLRLQFSTADQDDGTTLRQAALANELQQEEGPLTRLAVEIRNRDTSTTLSIECDLPTDITPTPLTDQCRNAAGDLITSRVEVTAATIAIQLDLEVRRGRNRVSATAFAGEQAVWFNMVEREVLLANDDLLVPLFRVATAADLENQSFRFADGAAFGLAGQVVVLNFDNFGGTNTGPVTLSSVDGTATGTATIATIDLVFTESSIPLIPPGTTLSLQATHTETGRLSLINTATDTRSVSALPVPATVPVTLESAFPRQTAIRRIEIQISGGVPAVQLTAICTIPTVIGTVTDQCRDARQNLLTSEIVVTQEDVTFGVTLGVPRGTENTRRITITAFVANLLRFFGVTEEVIDRAASIRLTVRPIATLANLQNQLFTFADGSLFGLAGQSVVLEFGSIDETSGLPVTLQVPATGAVATGTATANATAGTLILTFDVSQIPELPPGTVTFQATVNPNDSLNLVGLTAGLPVTSIPLPPIPARTVLIESPPAAVAPGATFPLRVAFNAAAMRVASYLLELTFDSTVVQIANIQGIAPFTPVVTNPVAFTSGTVRFAANNVAFTPANGVLTLAVITFRVTGTTGATSPLTLAFPTVPGGTGVIANDALQPIANVTVASGTVQVQ